MTDTPAPAAVLGRPGQAYEAARLRWATHADAARLAELWRRSYPDDAAGTAEMAEWLERGGALTMQDRGGELLAALRWREEGDGWRVDRVATRPDERGQGYGRWLTTKVEALAIRRSVPYLILNLPPVEVAEQLAYYQRMGYVTVEEDADLGVTLQKAVGGEWQTKAQARYGDAGQDSGPVAA